MYSKFTFLLALLALAFSSAAEKRTVRSLLEMRHDNVITQEWDLSCGAATLTTLLNYQHGDLVTEKEVATALMNRDIYVENPIIVQLAQGFSLLDLKRYVDARGYKGVGYGRLTVDDLIDKAPIIVPLNLSGYNHFVIFRGMLGDRVLLADPAWGNRTMTVTKFEKAWIDYPGIRHVGFVVKGKDVVAGESPGLLAPKGSDFPTLY